MRKLLTLLLLLLQIPVWAQLQDPIKWNISAKKTAPNEYDIIFNAKLDAGWHVYSQTINPDAGTPSNFVLKKGNFTLEGKIKESGKLKKKFDETSGHDLLYFEKTVDFIQHVKLTGPVSKIEGTYDF